MESTLVWTMIFAGAAIGLLGLFLFSSEKELRLKRREIEALSAKLNDAPEPNREPKGGDQDEPATDLPAEIVARNKELSEEIDLLTMQLHDSRNKIGDLHAAELRVGNLEAEVAQLRGSHQRLQEENVQLKNQLEDSEQRLQGPSTSSLETAERYYHMEAQVHQLSQELEKSQTRIQELEISQQRFAGLDFGNSALQDRQSLEARISELEQELAGEKQKLVDWEASQSRLRDLEQRCFGMDEDNKQLREELARDQQNVADSGENRRRLALVRERLDELELQQASLAQQHGKIREEMVALATLISVAPEMPVQLELSDDPFQNAGQPFELHTDYRVASPTDDRPDVISHYRGQSNEEPENSASESSHRQPSQAQHSSAANAQTNGKQSYKLLVAMIPVLLITGTVVAGFLRNRPAEPEDQATSTSPRESIRVRSAEAKPDAQKPVAVANQRPNGLPAAGEKTRETQVSAPAGYRNEAQVKTVSAISAGPNPRADESVSVKSKVAAKPVQGATQPSARAWGGYELVRSTQVYSEPTENAQSIAKLDAGTQVNVVSARDGWLEIRSKNGRPPGFIKSDTAVRMAQ